MHSLNFGYSLKTRAQHPFLTDPLRTVRHMYINAFTFAEILQKQALGFIFTLEDETVYRWSGYKTQYKTWVSICSWAITFNFYDTFSPRLDCAICKAWTSCSWPQKTVPQASCFHGMCALEEYCKGLLPFRNVYIHVDMSGPNLPDIIKSLISTQKRWKPHSFLYFLTPVVR